MKEELKALIAQQLNVDPDLIHDDTDIVEDLGADSLDIVELLMAFEDQYGIVIPDEDVLKLKIVEDAVAYIEKHREN